MLFPLLESLKEYVASLRDQFDPLEQPGTEGHREIKVLQSR